MLKAMLKCIRNHGIYKICNEMKRQGIKCLRIRERTREHIKEMNTGKRSKEKQTNKKTKLKGDRIYRYKPITIGNMMC
jgi:hypothetical protein